jgi:hypothetical protein
MGGTWMTPITHISLFFLFSPTHYITSPLSATT